MFLQVICGYCKICNSLKKKIIYFKTWGFFESIIKKKGFILKTLLSGLLLSILFPRVK